jgi:fatty-acyl-CoA synthase
MHTHETQHEYEGARDSALQGLMQPWSLTVNRILEHAARWHGAGEIVSRDFDGKIHRTTYGNVDKQARRFAAALARAGIKRGDRVATLAHNSARHVIAWYGIMGHGAISHTLNPRLFDEHLEFIVNDARDRWIVADALFAPLIARLLPRCPSVEAVVFLDGARTEPQLPVAIKDFDTLVSVPGESEGWGAFDENLACALCYTSGTTGQPKGVLYAHRSTVLHTLMTLQQDVFGLSCSDNVLQIVPMFHANGWGIPYSATAVGAKLVLPGPKLDSESIYGLLEGERITVSAAVPTIWQSLGEFLISRKLTLTTLKRVFIGGSSCPRSLMETFRDQFGVEVRHVWGMTEMSPCGTIDTPKTASTATNREAGRLSQGRVPFGVDMEIKDDGGAILPHDGATAGHLKVRGLGVVRQYYQSPVAAVDSDGYFDTGDVATIDSLGFMRITDRSKDLIKSGGEWISSVEIEDVVVSHPKVFAAAVIAMAHPKWRERPLLLVQLRSNCSSTRYEMLAFLEGKIARWWIPDEVILVSQMPLGPTGKIDKKRLRQLFPTTRHEEPHSDRVPTGDES